MSNIEEFDIRRIGYLKARGTLVGDFHFWSTILFGLL